MQRKQVTTLFLLALAAVALYLCYIIARPFLAPFFLAVMIAIVWSPIHARTLARIRRQNLAALISTLLVLVVFIVPTIGLGVAVHKELAGIVQSLTASSAEQGGWHSFLIHSIDSAAAWIGKYVDLSSFDLHGELLQWLKNVSQPLLAMGAQAITNLFAFIGNAVVTFFTLFYFFREGKSMKQQLGSILPLSSDQVKRLFSEIDNSIIANVYGCLAVSVSQGTLTGLAFWVLGLHSPVLWGLVTGLVSMIPVVGSGIVWAPAGIILIASGHLWKGLALLGWGAAIVSQVDNVVRPYVISQKANMHPLVVFFSLLGGVQAFGFLGLFVGPVVVSITIVVFKMLREMNADTTESPPPTLTSAAGNA